MKSFWREFCKQEDSVGWLLNNFSDEWLSLFILVKIYHKEFSHPSALGARERNFLRRDVKIPRLREHRRRRQSINLQARSSVVRGGTKDLLEFQHLEGRRKVFFDSSEHEREGGRGRRGRKMFRIGSNRDVKLKVTWNKKSAPSVYENLFWVSIRSKLARDVIVGVPLRPDTIYF